MIVQLYSVGKFYDELYYDPLADKFLRLRAFESIRQQVPYLEQIRFNLC